MGYEQIHHIASPQQFVGMARACGRRSEGLAKRYDAGYHAGRGCADASCGIATRSGRSVRIAMTGNPGDHQTNPNDLGGGGHLPQNE